MPRRQAIAFALSDNLVPGARVDASRGLLNLYGRQIFAAKYVKVLPTEQEWMREIERERLAIDSRRVGRQRYECEARPGAEIAPEPT